MVGYNSWSRKPCRYDDVLSRCQTDVEPVDIMESGIELIGRIAHFSMPLHFEVLVSQMHVLIWT